MAISALYNSGDFDNFGDNFGSIEDIMSTAPLTDLHAWMKVVPRAMLREKEDPRSPKIKDIYSLKKLSAFNLPS